MKTDSIAKRRSDRTWMTAESCKLDDFVKLVENRAAQRIHRALGPVEGQRDDAVRVALGAPVQETQPLEHVRPRSGKDRYDPGKPSAGSMRRRRIEI